MPVKIVLGFFDSLDVQTSGNNGNLKKQAV